MKILMILGLLILLVGCTSKDPLFADKVFKKADAIVVEIESLPNQKPAKMTIISLGVGGFGFDVNGYRIITAPSFTNPSFFRALIPIPLKANEGKINKLFPELWKDSKGASNNVQAILVGHTHYDHLLDVPYLMNSSLKEAKAYGSETMTAILHNFGIPCEGNNIRAFSNLSDGRGSKEVNGTRLILDNENISVRAIPSTHAPHVLNYTAQTGFYKCGRAFKLRSGWDWKMGDVLAFLIDFKDPADPASILFRVYYHDSAREPDSGKIPTEILKQRPVDIAILTLAGSNKAKKYPASVVGNAQASLYVVGHWENFFDNDIKAPKVILTTDQFKFIAKLESALLNGMQWIMPLPLSTITVVRP